MMSMEAETTVPVAELVDATVLETVDSWRSFAGSNPARDITYDYIICANQSQEIFDSEKGGFWTSKKPLDF